MCIDSTFNELTDTGGVVENIRNESFVKSAIRELKEETLGIFDYAGHEQFIYDNSFCIHDRSSILIFQRISVVHPTEISLLYKYLHTNLSLTSHNKCLLENSSLVWISESNVRNLCFTLNPQVFIPEDLKVCVRKQPNARGEKYAGIFYPEIFSEVKEMLISAFVKYEMIVM
jgi:hypothetical protein